MLDHEKKLDEIFRKVSRIAKDEAIDYDTEFDSLSSWDSLTYVELIAEVEKELNIKFDFDELLEANTWGSLKNLIIEIATK